MSKSQLSPEQRDALLSQLAAVAQSSGWEPLIYAPLLEPSASTFPDRWQPDARGVGVLASRLLRYAGVAAPRVRVHDYTALAKAASIEVPEVRFATALRDGTVVLELSRVGDADDLVGFLCHEGAAAWLELERLSAENHPYRNLVALGEQEHAADTLASIASVYLGFGIPAANAAYTPKHSGHFDGMMGVTEWQIASAGGLSIEAMTFLLAVQLIVRKRDDEAKLARSRMRPNQRALLRDWLELLAPDRERLLERLGLPTEQTWDGAEVANPEPLALDVDVVVEIESEAVAKFNRGRPVFRVRHRRPAMFAFFGGATALATAIVIAVAAALPSPAWLGLLGAGAGLGAIVGWRSIYYECSDADCQQRVALADTLCGFCGGALSGVLTNANQRLDAEERLLTRGDEEE